jgi:hypothetical protein
MPTTKALLDYDDVEVAVGAEPLKKGDLFIWPSVGEYQVYDIVLYYVMTHDALRNSRYEEAVKAIVPGKVALDIGTGAHLNWARACIEAGARKVYAIEEMADTYEAAQKLAKKLGIEDKLTLIHGSATTVELPEPVDVCVSEIIGCIGTSEGVMSVLRDAQRRFLKPDGVMIPYRCATRVGAVELPTAFHADPNFDKRFLRYIKNIFTNVGHSSDVRVCIENLDPACVLSTNDLFEDVEFSNEVPLESSREARIKITRPGRMDGLLLWIELTCMQGQAPINSLTDRTHWKPVFFPIFYPGIDVAPGDELVMTCEVRPSDNGVLPDYSVRGELRRAGRTQPFSYDAPHHGRSFRSNAFYERLFPLP